MWVLSSTASVQRPRSWLTVAPTPLFYIPPFFVLQLLSVEHLIGDEIRVVVKTQTPDHNIIKTAEYREQHDVWRSKPRQDLKYQEKIPKSNGPYLLLIGFNVNEATFLYSKAYFKIFIFTFCCFGFSKFWNSTKK